ncbi:peptidoglycan-binding protein [Streptomyces sp. NPDC052396]|uniref:peptidoglycan-binding protein n=1 Tax=Streptomyces sp. NPDC052396 TaxID=3365689 RepID=UPI0037D24995
MKQRSSLRLAAATAAVALGTLCLGAAPAPAATARPAGSQAPANNYGCAYYYGHALTEYGDRGPRVRQVQCLLSKWSLMDPSEVDGIFGGHTRDVVRGFQQENDLSPDGQVGVLTWARLRCEGGC